jgi:hypothetical protein
MRSIIITKGQWILSPMPHKSIMQRTSLPSLNKDESKKSVDYLVSIDDEKKAQRDLI